MAVTVEDLVERDGAACLWCGRELWRRDLTAEHLLPRRRGGRTRAENLAVACRSCNRRRGTQPAAAHLRAREADGLPVQPARLAAALGRLSACADASHAAYGARQLELLDRWFAQPPSAPGSAGTSTA